MGNWSFYTSMIDTNKTTVFKTVICAAMNPTLSEV